MTGFALFGHCHYLLTDPRTCGKTLKNVYTIRFLFFKLAINGQSDKSFLLTSKVCPKGVVCPCPGAIYMYKFIKSVYKIRFRRDHFKICGQRE